MCFHDYRTSFKLTVDHHQDDGIVMCDRISEETEDLLSDHLLTCHHIRGHYNTHHKELLIHSNINDKEDKFCDDFSNASDLI